MLKLQDFFGLSIDSEKSDIGPVLKVLGIDNDIENTKVVKSLKQSSGQQAPIVSVARRQQVLKLIRPMLNEDMLDHEDSYYNKEINTSSEYDRRYGAEDKLLSFALLVASTKSIKMLQEDSNILTAKQLREAAFRGTRFDKCWDILSEETNHIVTAFRKSKK